jgi:methylmalonyl-CoA/ethylmalonyl-CoA epimerase
MLKKIDHISIAVEDLEAEIKRYRDILGLEWIGTETVEDQKVQVAFFKIGDAHIELTAPTAEDSPISKFLKKRGSGIHHIAVETDNIQSELSQLEDRGIRLIDKEPRHGAHNSLIAFAHPKSFSGVLLELTEKGE